MQNSLILKVVYSGHISVDILKSSLFYSW